VYSDGWKNESDRPAVEEVREYLRTVDGFKSVLVKRRESNYGLGNSIIAGVSETINHVGEVIVLEDDLVTSPFFLKYINRGLQLYEQHHKVISIHGYSYPSKVQLPETYFLKGADCLGWGTWKRGWDLFESDGRKLLREIEERNLSRSFDFDDSYPYTQMLRDQIDGKNTSWAVRWYASAFLKEKLTLYPTKTLVSHIGYDAGTNFATTLRRPEKLVGSEISVRLHEPQEDDRARAITAAYLRRLQGGLVKNGLRKFKFLKGRLSEAQRNGRDPPE
jgi:glycosyltransferase involved in cell wall biosynthesis